MNSNFKTETKNKKPVTVDDLTQGLSNGAMHSQADLILPNSPFNSHLKLIKESPKNSDQSSCVFSSEYSGCTVFDFLVLACPV